MTSLDTLSVVNQLEAAGFTRAQADIVAREERLYRELVTKADLRAAIHEAKYDLLKWMVAGFVANAAVIIAVIRLLK